MKKPLFDSHSEERLFAALEAHWAKYIKIYPHIPVRKVLGYRELHKLPVSQRATEYFLRTEFDFVVCSLNTCVPLLAIEFDGIGHGFSSDGQYVSKVVPLNDPYRKLKLDAKLEACTLAGFPLVVVSFEEIRALEQREDSLTVLDAIIGQVITSIHTHEEVIARMDDLSSALEAGPDGDMAAYMLITEIETINEEKHNPIYRKTADIAKRIPCWGLPEAGRVRMLRDRPGYVGARFAIYAGITSYQGRSRIQELISTTIYIREVNCPGCSTFALLESIGKYCLARKALREVGTDREAWAIRADNTPWTEL